jgi:hypothetical protein
MEWFEHKVEIFENVFEIFEVKLCQDITMIKYILFIKSYVFDET